MSACSRFDFEPAVGQTARGESSGPGYVTAWSGTYRGVRVSEWDGRPVHYFTDGIIGATPQACFALPVDQFNDSNEGEGR